VARPRKAVGCRTLICRKADSGQLNDLTTRQVELRDRQLLQPASCCVNTTAYLSPSGASSGRSAVPPIRASERGHWVHHDQVKLFLNETFLVE